jgi:hypothetical protein
MPWVVLNRETSLKLSSCSSLGSADVRFQQQCGLTGGKGQPFVAFLDITQHHGRAGKDGLEHEW